jgi:hypothetical protein
MGVITATALARGCGEKKKKKKKDEKKKKGKIEKNTI